MGDKSNKMGGGGEPPTYLVHVTLKGVNDSSMFSYDKMSIILLDIQKRLTCHMQSRDGGNK